jgi:hypothetical protein
MLPWLNLRALILITKYTTDKCNSATYKSVLQVSNNTNDNINPLLLFILDVALIRDNIICLLPRQRFTTTLIRSSSMIESSKVYIIKLEYNIIKVKDIIILDKES